MRVGYWIIILLLLSISIHSRCRIELVLKGYENQTVIFSSQLGKRVINIDTLKIDSKGESFYQSSKKLPGGIYMLILPNQSVFEFLIADEQFFTLRSDTSDFLKKMSVEGAIETSLFHDFQLKSVLNANEKTMLFNLKKNAPVDSQVFYSQKIARLDEELRIFRKNIIEKFSNAFISNYLLLHEEPKPLQVQDQNQISPKFFRLQYYHMVEHYFDSFVFSDERIIRTNIFEEKLDYYFDRLLTQNYDSIIRPIDKLAAKSTVNQEVHRFIMNYLLNHYRNRDFKGSEIVYLHLVNNHYLSGKTPWADDRFLRMLKEKSKMMSTSIPGSDAPDLNLITNDGKNLSLHSVSSKYLLLFFWSADCNECTEYTKEFKKINEQYKSKGLKIMAVYTFADKKAWEKSIEEQKQNWINVYDPLRRSGYERLYQVKKTPLVYLIDQKMKIVLPNTNPLEIVDFLKKSLN